MTIEHRLNQALNYDLLSYLKDIDCTDMQFKILCFWGRHPKAKLTLYTVARALDTSRIKLRDSITALVEKGILIAQDTSDGLTTYALSEQQTKEYIDELCDLEWCEKINFVKQLRTRDKSFIDHKE